MHFHEFIRLPAMGALLELMGHEEVNLLVRKARGGQDRGQACQDVCRHPDLFLQLTLRAGGWGLARIQAARGYLPDEAIGGMTELTDEVDPWIRCAGLIDEGNYGRSTRVTDHLQLAG